MNLVWHDQPDAAVIQICRNLEILNREQGSEAYWAECRRLCKTDLWFLMRVVMQWGWLDEDLVGTQFIKAIAEHTTEGGKLDKAIIMPRGHGKTLPMSAVCVNDILNNPDTAILNLTRTEDNALKFAGLVGEHLISNPFLQRCFAKKHNPETGFLPSAVSECKLWGKDGYSLPWRKPRIDPTLLAISLKAAKAGKHPDWIYVDDPTEAENNAPDGWAHVIEMINGLKMLLPPDGYIVWSGTRWHDGDPLGKVERGVFHGKQGPFKILKRSCYVNDNPNNPPTYPRKIRWNMTKPTGYTHEALEAMRKPEEEGGLGEFFDAQMRNDPIPSERALIKVKDINLYDAADQPKTTDVKLMGIEVTGGGLPIFNGFKEYCDELKINVPIYEIVNPRKVGISKADRIVTALQPLVDSGKIWAQDWMIGDESATEGLGYELRRIGKATHDDIADALHNLVTHLCKDITPKREGDPADLYISVDLAWTEKQRSDFAVAIAACKDHKGNIWVLDYDRFRISSPTGIYQRLLAFYQNCQDTETTRQRVRKKTYWR